MSVKTDFLVIGSGIAGLSFALKAARHGKVTIITKSNEDESNTKYAQGGIAAVLPGSSGDSREKHIEDTLICGAGLCNEKVVRMVVNESYARIDELIKWEQSLIKIKPVIMIWHERVVIPSTESCTIKILPVWRLKGSCFSKYTVIPILPYILICLQWILSHSIILAKWLSEVHQALHALELM